MGNASLGPKDDIKMAHPLPTLYPSHWLVEVTTGCARIGGGGSPHGREFSFACVRTAERGESCHHSWIAQRLAGRSGSCFASFTVNCAGGKGACHASLWGLGPRRHSKTKQKAAGEIIQRGGKARNGRIPSAKTGRQRGGLVSGIRGASRPPTLNVKKK